MGRRFWRLRSRIDPAGADTATASFRPRLPPELEFRHRLDEYTGLAPPEDSSPTAAGPIRDLLLPSGGLAEESLYHLDVAGHSDLRVSLHRFIK